MSCSSTECPIFRYCKNAIPTLNSSAIPYASYGSGGTGMKTDYWCGPNGKYRLFKPIGMPDTESTTTKQNPTASLFRAYKGEKRFYLLFKRAIDIDHLSNYAEKFITGYISSADGVEYHSRLTLHMESFSYGAINLMAFDFIEPVDSEITLLKGFTEDISMVFPYKSPSAK